MAKAGPRAASALLTIGPFFPAGLAEPECRDLTRNGARGLPIVLGGRVLEAGPQPVRNAVVEIWQPDRNGLFAHPADPRASEADPKFRFWGRCRTDADGGYQFRTIMPGSRSDNTVGTRLPHINMMVLASGIMRRLVTTLFFADDPQAEDPVLRAVPAGLRERLLARPAAELDGAGGRGYRFDVVLQGAGETPFFLD